jgi:TolB protein
LRLEITEGVIEPLPFALPTFIAADGGASDVAQDITRVIAADLRGTGLFRQIPPDAYISQVTSFDSPVQYPDWQAINAQALITGEVETRGAQIVVRFRLYRRVLPGAAGRRAAIRGGGRKLAAHGPHGRRRGL